MSLSCPTPPRTAAHRRTAHYRHYRASVALPCLVVSKAWLRLVADGSLRSGGAWPWPVCACLLTLDKKCGRPVDRFLSCRCMYAACKSFLWPLLRPLSYTLPTTRRRAVAHHARITASCLVVSRACLRMDYDADTRSISNRVYIASRDTYKVRVA